MIERGLKRLIVKKGPYLISIGPRLDLEIEN